MLWVHWVTLLALHLLLGNIRFLLRLLLPLLFTFRRLWLARLLFLLHLGLLLLLLDVQLLLSELLQLDLVALDELGVLEVLVLDILELRWLRLELVDDDGLDGVIILLHDVLVQ